MKLCSLKTHLLGLAFIISLQGNGQSINGLPIVQNFTPQEYGAHRQNWQIVQAPSGILYFANGKGLLSFNGEEWQLTMMPNRGHVRSLDVDKNGTVFVGANNDFGKLIMNSSGQREFQSFLPLVDTMDHDFGRVRKTICTDNGVYFQAYKRIFRIENETIKTWRFESTIYRIFYAHNQLYAIDLERGLLFLKDDEFVLAEHGSFLKHTRISPVLPFGENLLIGTRNDGLFLYDHQQFTPFKTEADPVFKNNGLYDGLISDDDKIVMITDSRNGVYVLGKNGAIEQVINENTGINSNDILGVFEDQYSSLWVGTQEGLTRIDYGSPYSTYDDRLGLGGTIQSIASFENQIFGASSDGLIKINSGQLKDTISKVGNIDSYCWEIEQWSDQLLIASSRGAYALKGNEMLTLQGGNQFATGISKSPHDSLAIILVLDEGMSYQKWNGANWIELGRITGISGAVRDVVEDEKGAFWLKTRSNGIFRFKMPTQDGTINFDEFTSHHYDLPKGIPQGENNIFKIDDQMLVRSEQDSLYLFNSSTNRFEKTTSWGKQFGFEGGLVLPKTKEQDGVFWLDYFVDGKKWLLRAEKKLDKSYEIKKYPFSSKMLNFKDPFGNEVFYADKDQLWFGGMKGILQVDLNKLTTNSKPLPLLITEVRNSETPLFVLGTSLNNNEIAFQHNDLSFKYSAPFYQNKEHLYYATFLEGYDKKWSDWTKVSNKNYTNLPSGDYLFKVKTKNDFDNVSEVAMFSFRIKPPWFVTSWAILTYFLLAALLIWLIIHLRSANLRKEQIRLEKIVDERTEEIKKQAEEINELYEVKNRFLANISHELRTPLTLILGPAEQLLLSVSESAQKKQLSWIHQNSQKLLKLINQLLDLSKIEAGKLELKTSQQDLVKFSRYICSAFESLAKQKKVELIFKSSVDHLYLFFDAEKMEKVLNNLLNNALKFTDNGQVVFQIDTLVEDENSIAKITLTDSGIGIHEQQLPYIFDRFYQADQSEETFYQGTGIGLALSKELVELHSGKIEASSEIGKGTIFTIILPINETQLEDNISNIATDFIPVANELETSLALPVAEENEASNEKPLILIVDDNADIIDYIQHQLGANFRTLKASDGKEGFEIAERELPDLIVSDVMMPQMNGFELCSKLKNDIKTDHIPVILLTARIGEEDKMQGLQNQADDYLQKPFNSKELEIRNSKT